MTAVKQKTNKLKQLIKNSSN